MSSGSDDDKVGTILSFPNGEQVSVDEVGAGYVVGQGGIVPTAQLIDHTLIEKDLRERDAYVKSQPLVKIISQKAPISDLVDEVLNEIAEELSHLKYERRKASKEGKNTANYTISRIASLKQLAEVLQKRQENARAERFDLKSPKFKQILHLWMEFLYESMTQAGLDDGTIDTVFKTMESNMTDWEKRLVDTVE